MPVSADLSTHRRHHEGYPQRNVFPYRKTILLLLKTGTRTWHGEKVQARTFVSARARDDQHCTMSTARRRAPTFVDICSGEKGRSRRGRRAFLANFFAWQSHHVVWDVLGCKVLFSTCHSRLVHSLPSRSHELSQLSPQRVARQSGVSEGRSVRSTWLESFARASESCKLGRLALAVQSAPRRFQTRPPQR